MPESCQLFLGQPRPLGGFWSNEDDRGRVLHHSAAVPLPNRNSVQLARDLPDRGSLGGWKEDSFSGHRSRGLSHNALLQPLMRSKHSQNQPGLQAYPPTSRIPCQETV